MLALYAVNDPRQAVLTAIGEISLDGTLITFRFVRYSEEVYCHFVKVKSLLNHSDPLKIDISHYQQLLQLMGCSVPAVN